MKIMNSWLVKDHKNRWTQLVETGISYYLWSIDYNIWESLEIINAQGLIQQSK